MSGEDFGLRLGHRRELLGDRLCHTPMQLSPPTLEERLIGGIVDERMLELIGSLRRNAARVDQLRVGKLLKRRLQFLFGNRRDSLKQLVGELAPDHRRY